MKSKLFFMRISSALLVLGLVVVGLMGCGSTENAVKENDTPFSIRINADTVTITEYRGTVKDVVIPERIGGLPVTTIGSQAFYNNQLTSVAIPGSVTSIEYGAFYNNQLTSVAIPDSVTSIGPQAFYNNQLTSVTIPGSVTSIEDGAFYNNQLTSVTIPDSVITIGYQAFYNNQLTSVTIPDSVTTIGKKAFEDNQLTRISVSDCSKWAVSLEEEAFAGNAGNPFVIATDGKTAIIIGYNSDNKMVVIPERIDNLPIVGIGDWVFYKTGLFGITIPNTVAFIGRGAFESNQLTSITIPDSVASIGDRAFYDSGIRSVVLPKSVTYIGTDAFSRSVSVMQK
jgi:hypothetical protein